MPMPAALGFYHPAEVASPLAMQLVSERKPRGPIPCGFSFTDRLGSSVLAFPPRMPVSKASAARRQGNASFPLQLTFHTPPPPPP